MAKSIERSVLGKTEGFVILNEFGDLWIHQLFPTEQAAGQFIQTHMAGTFRLKVVRGHQKITWDRGQ